MLVTLYRWKYPDHLPINSIKDNFKDLLKLWHRILYTLNGV